MQRQHHSPTLHLETEDIKEKKRLTLHLKQGRCQTFPKALTKAPSNGSEHAAQTAEPAGGAVDELAAFDPPAAEGAEESDVMLERFRVESSALLEPSSEWFEEDAPLGLLLGVNGRLSAWKAGIEIPFGLAALSERVWFRSSLRACGCESKLGCIFLLSRSCAALTVKERVGGGGLG